MSSYNDDFIDESNIIDNDLIKIVSKENSIDLFNKYNDNTFIIDNDINDELNEDDEYESLLVDSNIKACNSLNNLVVNDYINTQIDKKIDNELNNQEVNNQTDTNLELKYDSHINLYSKVNISAARSLSDTSLNQSNNNIILTKELLDKHNSNQPNNHSTNQRFKSVASKNRYISTLGKRPVVINIYQRLLGHKSSTTISTNPINDEYDHYNNISTITNIKEKLFSFISGESDHERRTRLRLLVYKDNLIHEVNLFKCVRDKHSNHKLDLITDFENQEIQLQQWGLTQILPIFRIQAWSRVCRATLLEDMSAIALQKFEKRLDKALKVIQHFLIERKSSKKFSLTTYNDFCQSPESLLARDDLLSSIGQRLAKMDKICSYSLLKFRKFLPELNKQEFIQRQHLLQDLVKRYSLFLTLPIPSNKDDSKAWPEFCKWYSGRLEKTSAIERVYVNFIDDEREREGRLFRRWYTQILQSSNDEDNQINITNQNLTNPSETDLRRAFLNESQSNVFTSRDNVYNQNVSYDLPSKFKQSLQGSVSKSQLSPRSIRAFIRYFSVEIIAEIYKIPPPYDALIALTEAAAFRKLNTKIFRYPYEKLLVRDIKWRNKCKLCRYVDPLTYGVTNDYLYGPKDISTTEDNIDDTIVSKIEEEVLTGNSDYDKKFSDTLSSLSLYPNLLNIDSYVDTNNDKVKSRYGNPYLRSSRMLTMIASSIQPKDIIFNLLISIKWLLAEAALISKCDDLLGADAMFPILVLVLINSNIPNMHLILYILHNYYEFEGRGSGEASYYTTSIEAAVAFILRADTSHISSDELELEDIPLIKSNRSRNQTYVINDSLMSNIPIQDIINDSITTNNKIDSNNVSVLNSNDLEDDLHMLLKNKSNDSEDNKAMDKLGAWLRDQNTTEETINILKEEGWMV